MFGYSCILASDKVFNRTCVSCWEGLGGDLGTFVTVLDQTQAYGLKSDVSQPAAGSVTMKNRINFILRPKLYNMLRGTVF